MFCLVPWLTTAMEMRARRQFMQQEGISSITVPPLIDTWLRHSWLLVLCVWAMFV